MEEENQDYGKTKVKSKPENILVVTFDEVMQAYLDCRKHKRSTVNAIKFEMDLHKKIYNLYLELNKGIYFIGESIAFCVDRPVKREVFAADFRDRIVHHLLMNKLTEILEKNLIDDVFACRECKGTSYAVNRCAYHIQAASNNYTEKAYIVKCDLKSYFMTISKTLLLEKLLKYVDEYYEPDNNYDLDFVKWLITIIIMNRPQENCKIKCHRSRWNGLPKEKSLFWCDPDKGLPIGNLTSQNFANFYLSEFDKFMKEELGLKYYGRYVDDFYFIVKDVKEARVILEKCKQKLAEIGVTLHPKKIYIQEVHKGVKFVGKTIKPNRTTITNRTKGNFYDKLKEFYVQLEEIKAKGLEPTPQQIEYFVSSINSYFGYMVDCATYNIRLEAVHSEFMKGWLEYCYYDEHLRKLTIFSEYVAHKPKKKMISKKEFYESGMDKEIEAKVMDIAGFSEKRKKMDEIIKTSNNTKNFEAL